MEIFSKNKTARHDYILIQDFTAGLVLSGPEVKSICEGRISLKESYVKVQDGEAWLMQAHITKMDNVASWQSFDEVRPRKLLLTKREIAKLAQETQERGITIVATKIYKPTDNNKIKLDISIARGKQLHDKRNSLKEKDIARDTARQMKDY